MLLICVRTQDCRCEDAVWRMTLESTGSFTDWLPCVAAYHWLSCVSAGLVVRAMVPACVHMPLCLFYTQCTCCCVAYVLVACGFVGHIASARVHTCTLLSSCLERCSMGPHWHVEYYHRSGPVPEAPLEGWLPGEVGLVRAKPSACLSGQRLCAPS